MKDIIRAAAFEAVCYATGDIAALPPEQNRLAEQYLAAAQAKMEQASFQRSAGAPPTLPPNAKDPNFTWMR
jgi:hypothetical protein